jgi:hypothetical protein
MAAFFITSTMVNNGKAFQFKFETESAHSVSELVELLNSGGFVIGKRRAFDRSNGEVLEDIAICSTVVNMIQSSR